MDYKNYLYYYCSLDTAISKILPKKRLLMSPLKNTNDPRESLSSFLFGTISSYISETTDLEKISDDASKILMSGVKVLCFSKATNEIIGGYESPAMWAHYGGNHKGICIEIDKSKFIKENSNIAKNLKPVTYQNGIRDWDNIYIDKDELEKDKKKYLLNTFRLKHKKYLYYTKHEDWRYEKEIRLIHFSKTEEKEYINIGNSISRIFTGVKFNPNYLPSIKQLISHDIDIISLQYQYGAIRPTRLLEESKKADIEK